VQRGLNQKKQTMEWSIQISGPRQQALAELAAIPEVPVEIQTMIPALVAHMPLPSGLNINGKGGKGSIVSLSVLGFNFEPQPIPVTDDQAA
jgi:hypothetical protein